MDSPLSREKSGFVYEQAYCVLHEFPVHGDKKRFNPKKSTQNLQGICFDV